MVSPLPNSPQVGRRAAVATGFALLATTACDLDPRTSSEATPVPTAGAPTAPDEDADLALLDRARDGVIAMLGSVRVTRRRHRSLRAPLAYLVFLHREHLGLLDGAGRPGPGAAPDATPDDPAAVPPRAGRALADVRAAELRLERALGEHAVAAGSGDFARLLASMAAGVAQAAEQLPEGP